MCRSSQCWEKKGKLDVTSCQDRLALTGFCWLLSLPYFYSLCLPSHCQTCVCLLLLLPTCLGAHLEAPLFRAHSSPFSDSGRWQKVRLFPPKSSALSTWIFWKAFALSQGQMFLLMPHLCSLLWAARQGNSSSFLSVPMSDQASALSWTKK